MTSASISVLSIFKNEATNFEEWINHYLINQQVDRIILIDNGSTDNWKPIVDNHKKKERITLLTDTRKHCQHIIYKDVFESGLIDTEWLLVCDLDEFAYARSGFTSLGQYLSQVDKETSFVMLPWKNFGSSGYIKQPSSIRKSFTRRAPVPFPEPQPGVCRGKYICRVRHTSRIDVHHAESKNGDCRYKLSSGRDITEFKSQIYRGMTPYSEQDLKECNIHLNHYASQSLQYFKEIKSTRGDVFHRRMDVKQMSYFEKFDRNDVSDRELADMVTMDNFLTNLNKGFHKNLKKIKQKKSIFQWHKKFIKRIRQRFGLSKYQILWITFGKGLVIGYVLAFLIHR